MWDSDESSPHEQAIPFHCKKILTTTAALLTGTTHLGQFQNRFFLAAATGTTTATTPTTTATAGGATISSSAGTHDYVFALGLTREREQWRWVLLVCSESFPPEAFPPVLRLCLSVSLLADHTNPRYLPHLPYSYTSFITISKADSDGEEKARG